MRMRKKKNTESRILSCSEILVTDPVTMKGNWNEKAKDRILCLEIGCGKGSFVCEMAKKHPERFFIAIEKVRDVLVMAMEKAKESELSNVVFMDFDAKALSDVFENQELEEIYLNFSDPWPKKKHAKRRLTHRTFLEIYRNILKKDGTIYFKTDNRNLFDFSLQELNDCNFKLSDITYDLHNSEYSHSNIVTEYEKTFSEKGFSINRVVAKP